MAVYFIVRVVLHCPEDEAAKRYTELHLAMHQKGFIRTITAKTGERYLLPHAEYWYPLPATSDSVFKAARAAAESACRKCAVLVSACELITFEGLPRVKPGSDPDVADAAELTKRLAEQLGREAALRRFVR